MKGNKRNQGSERHYMWFIRKEETKSLRANHISSFPFEREYWFET